MCFFFFQAEDGIRDVAVTGVQTCALPISDHGTPAGSLASRDRGRPCEEPDAGRAASGHRGRRRGCRSGHDPAARHECGARRGARAARSEEHTSELQSRLHLVCRLLLEKKKLGDNINGCSAACYVALISGTDNGVSDGYSCCLTGTTLVDQLQSAGLTWQAYCESGCPRGNDHFPFTGFASDANSPDIFTGSSVTTSQFIAEANSASPPNFLWYTPTDNHNMHDNSVSSGDSYLKKFLVGNGTVLTPAPGSLLASSLFGNSQYRTLLYLWWDEYDPSPNVEYGSMIKKGYTSTASYDEFSSLRMLETNWNLGTLVNSGNALPISDIFGAIGPLPLSTSFTLIPLTPIVNATVNLTAIVSGGTLPYSYSWSFGDGATGTGLATTHAYTGTGNYSVTLTAHDSAGGSATSTQSVRVLSVLPLAASFTASPTIPDAGQTVTFTAAVQGGNGPYSYSWNLGGTSKTGNPVSQSFTNGTYAISLAVTDNTSVTATSSESLVVLPSPTAMGSVPVLIGWGGIRMDESVANTADRKSTRLNSSHGYISYA